MLKQTKHSVIVWSNNNQDQVEAIVDWASVEDAGYRLLDERIFESKTLERYQAVKNCCSTLFNNKYHSFRRYICVYQRFRYIKCCQCSAGDGYDLEYG